MGMRVESEKYWPNQIVNFEIEIIIVKYFYKNQIKFEFLSLRSRKKMK